MKFLNYFVIINNNMNKQLPILTAAGRETVSVDAQIFTQLLASYVPHMVGITNKLECMEKFAVEARCFSNSANMLQSFKDYITSEFLQLQLMEAVSIAKATSEDVSAPVDSWNH